MVTLDPGTLNRLITIQQQVTTQDAVGQQSQAVAGVRTCWASVRTSTSKEVYAAAGFVSQLSHVITIRYKATPAIAAGMQVSYAGRTYRVQAVSDPDDCHVVQQLLCLEVVHA